MHFAPFTPRFVVKIDFVDARRMKRGEMVIQSSYPLQSDPLGYKFWFDSHGEKGTINKCIVFSRTMVPNLFNLAFGDWDPISETIDDLSISNNGDRELVLQTVAAAVFQFTKVFPKAKIFATGSTPARTRLYRIGISKNFDEIVSAFEIWGYLEGKWVPFETNLNFKAFMIIRKIL